MAVAVVTKQPAERLILPAPFPAGTRIAYVVEAAGVARGLVAGAAPIAVTAAGEDGAAIVDVSGGTDGERYLLTIRAATDAAEQLEAEIEVVVIDAAWTMPDGGVAYLTIAEFVDNFGLEETVRMTDADGSGRIDRALLVAALRAAQGVADLNLAARYAVPLSVTPPDAVKTAIADIARARLYPRGAPDGVAAQTKDAVRVLERIASGALPLPLPAGQSADAAAVAPTPILISPGTRRYPRGTDVWS